MYSVAQRNDTGHATKTSIKLVHTDIPLTATISKISLCTFCRIFLEINHFTLLRKLNKLCPYQYTYENDWKNIEKLRRIQ